MILQEYSTETSEELFIEVLCLVSFIHSVIVRTEYNLSIQFSVTRNSAEACSIYMFSIATCLFDSQTNHHHHLYKLKLHQTCNVGYCELHVIHTSTTRPGSQPFCGSSVAQYSVLYTNVTKHHKKSHDKIASSLAPQLQQLVPTCY